MGHNIYLLQLLKSENKIGGETEMGKGESKNGGKCRRETMGKEKKYHHFSLNYSITDILQLFISLLKLLHFNNIYRHSK